MRKISIRFRNQEDLDTINRKLNTSMDNLTKEVTITNNYVTDVKCKKGIAKRGMRKTEWKEHWFNMPEFNVNFKDECYVKIDFLFEETEDNFIEEMFEQKITKRTTSLWFPKLKFGLYRKYRVIGGEQPKYPIYVISKGRYKKETWHTSFRLSQMGVKHFLVVEPQEYDKYIENFNDEYVTVLKMDLKYKEDYDCFSDLGNKNSTGPGAVRNFCWDDSIKRGYDWHWVLDDNIDGFNRFWRGKRLLCRTGEVFRTCERFIERYENIGIAGLNYSSFCKSGDRVPPYVLNTRIYSMLLINNKIPFRWRGRYNEDTDLSLRVLKSGLCTVQFNIFLGEKLTTQRKKGGNTDEFYEKEGTDPKSQMLVDMHPDVCKKVYKFHRIHHQVDYSGFTQKLSLKEDYVNQPKEDNEYGMRIITIPEELKNTINDNSEYINKYYYDNGRIDNTNMCL